MGANFRQPSHPTRKLPRYGDNHSTDGDVQYIRRYPQASLVSFAGSAAPLSAADREHGCSTRLSNGLTGAASIKSLFFAFIIASVSAYLRLHRQKAVSIKWARRPPTPVVCGSVPILFADLIFTQL